MSGSEGSQGRNAKVKDKNAKRQIKIRKGNLGAGFKEQRTIFAFLFVILAFHS